MSKIGVHVIIGPRQGFGAEFVQKIAAAGQLLPLVKCVDDFGAAAEAKAANSATLTIGRINEGPGGEDLQAFEPKNFVSPQAAADIYYGLVKPKWVLNPQIDVWETFNEYSGNWSWQADFYIRLMDLAEAGGYRLGLWSCSGGNPPAEQLPEIARACARAKAHGNHILCLHEYAWDGLLKDTLKIDPASHQIVGNGVVLYYRDVYAYLKAHNADIPIVLTECGENGGGGFVGKKVFVADFAAMDVEWMKDDYLLGVAAWTLGNWSGANFQDALPRLADLIIQNPTPKTLPPSEPAALAVGGSMVPPDTSITDSAGNVWTLGSNVVHGQTVLRNGVQFASGQGQLLLYHDQKVYAHNDLNEWWVATDTEWQRAPGDPRS